MTTPPAPIHGIPIQVDRHLIGSKKAVRIGNGPIVLSPAMYELVKGAESQEELRRLLEAIPLLQLPAMPSLYGPLPMTTRPF